LHVYGVVRCALEIHLALQISVAVSTLCLCFFVVRSEVFDEIPVSE
jgi:hypothetical protein